MAIVCAVVLLMLSAQAISETTSATVLANRSVEIESLSPAQLRMIFAGRTQFWADGTRIRVFVLQPNGSDHQHFCRTLLNIYPYQLERIWQRVIYSGQGDAPTTVESAQAMLKAIKNTPGAIGYSPDIQEIPDTVHVISVEIKDE